VLGVASLVLEDGGDEDEFIAALLHDSIEDAGVPPEEIQRRFGPRVRRIVEAATDTLADGRRGPETWRQRKTLYLEHLRAMTADARRVALADKVHNARAMLRDYRAVGEQLWQRFNAGRDDQIWYYRGLAAALGNGSANAEELRRTVEQLAEGVGEKRVPWT
jgi:(p)ppGpp synthase/HD superfamily hydrolase